LPSVPACLTAFAISAFASSEGLYKSFFDELSGLCAETPLINTIAVYDSGNNDEADPFHVCFDIPFTQIC